MNSRLRTPCSFQGGKQRIAQQIVDHLLAAAPGEDCRFYDLCCGSGAISIELVNRGVDPSRIWMLDVSSWGVFWSAIGMGKFKTKVFDQLISDLPNEKHELKAYMSALAKLPADNNEAELYPILQACSFGGKQIWRNGKNWSNACFRSYWMPTETSTRRSHANPMQPSPEELSSRVHRLVHGMRGINCLNADIMTLVESHIPDNSVVYIDPPYSSTTSYAFDFNLKSFISLFRKKTNAPMFVSEGRALNDQALMLTFGGAKGGISGTKKGKHQEWLNRV